METNNTVLKDYSTEQKLDKPPLHLNKTFFVPFNTKGYRMNFIQNEFIWTKELQKLFDEMDETITHQLPVCQLPCQIQYRDFDIYFR